jgi:molybdopterin-binding protein
VEANAVGRPGDEVLVCLRPEDIILAPPADAARATSARNRLPATVNRITSAGPHASVALDAGFPLVALITKQSLEELALGRFHRPRLVQSHGGAPHLAPAVTAVVRDARTNNVGKALPPRR